MHYGSNHNAPDNIHEYYQQASNRIAAHKFGRTIHGPVKGTFRFQLLTAIFGFLFGDHTCRQVTINGHLLARHGVQSKAGGNLGDPARTLCDNNEVHDHQNGEHDRPDDVAAADDEGAEGLNNSACSIAACMAILQNQTC